MDKIGPYVVERELGSGQMGVVYRVRHPELDHVYALKLLRAELCEAADIVRFRREVEQLAALTGHPNVVAVHSAGEDRGRLYFVMELVDGPTLEQLARRGEVDPPRAATWTRDVARALAALHARGGVHRDVKPSNVLVDGEGRARLTDFGLARGVTGDRLSRTGELLGTPLYMAPEQALGLPVGPAADVYALGGTLFMLLAGRPPVDAGSLIEVLDRVGRGVRRRLRDLVPGAPATLDAIIERALSVDPAARPTADELARDLDAFARGDAPAPDPRARGLRPLVAAALASVALMAGAIGWVAARPRAALPGARLAAAERLAGTLAAPGGPAAGDRAELAALLSASAVAGAPDATDAAARGWALALDGEVALREGDVARARARLAEASALADIHGAPPVRALERVGLAALRAGVAAADADLSAADALVRLADLDRAAERWPGRRDLAAWRVRLALRAGRLDLALAEVRAGPDLPAALRLEALLAAAEREPARFSEAMALEPELGPGDDALRGRLAWRRARAALRTLADLPVARGLAERAVALAPDDPDRAALAGAVRTLEAGGWPAPQPKGSDLREDILRMIAAHELLALLVPGHRLSDERIDHIELFNTTARGSLIEGLDRPEGRYRERLLALAPGNMNLTLSLLESTANVEDARPERDLPRFARGREVARAVGDGETGALDRIDELEARYLLGIGREPELRALADRFDRESARRIPAQVALVRSRLAEVLRRQGRLAEALVEVDRALALDRFSLEAQRARFDCLAPGVADEASRTAALEAGWRWFDAAVAGSRDEFVLQSGTRQLVDLEVQAGRPERALEAYGRALAALPDDMPALAARRLRLLCDVPGRVSELAAGLRKDLPRRLAFRLGQDQRANEPAVVVDGRDSMRDAQKELPELALAAERGELAVAAGKLDAWILIWGRWSY